MSLLDDLVAYVEDEGWTYRRLEDRPALQVAYPGEHGVWNCYLVARDEHAQVLVYSVFAEPVAPERRADTAEFLMRANYGLMVGNFEMDLSDGDVRYKTSIQLDAPQIPLETVRNVVLPNLVVMDRYLPGLRAVAGSGLTARAALSLVEGPAESDGG